MNINQSVDLYQPFAASKIGPPPIALRVLVTKNADSIVGGTQEGIQRVETYVLMSALPVDMQEKIKLALQLLISGR